MFSRPVSRWGEKAVGFASVAVAILTESAPTIARIQRASSKTYTVAILDNHNVAPEALDKSMISLRRTSARSRGRMLCLRQWIARQFMPVLTMRYNALREFICLVVLGGGRSSLRRRCVRGGASWGVRILLPHFPFSFFRRGLFLSRSRWLECRCGRHDGSSSTHSFRVSTTKNFPEVRL